MDNSKDEMRLCPTCRMPISVLATRCRYCGERVGRPRKEEEKYSANDLGGEQNTTYTISGNVRDALESFRVEVLGQNLADEDSGVRAAPSKPKPTPPAAKSGIGTPPPRQKTLTGVAEVDKHFEELSDLVEEMSSSTVRRPPLARRSDAARQAILFGSIALGVVIGAIVLRFAWISAQEYMEAKKRAQLVVYENKARTMLAQHKTLEALEEANTALGVNDTPANRAILEEVRNAFAAEIDSVLQSVTWSQDTLREVSRKVALATQKDQSPALLALQRRVDDDIAYYKLILRQADPGAGKATFIVKTPGAADQEQTVGEGQHIAGRFLVKKIFPGQVRLEDTEVKNGANYRQINCRIMTPAEPA